MQENLKKRCESKSKKELGNNKVCQSRTGMRRKKTKKV